MMTNKPSRDAYDFLGWWLEELTLDERRELKKAKLVCRDNGSIKCGPNANVALQMQVLLDYLRQSDPYWEERLATNRPPNSLKWSQMYRRCYELIREKDYSGGKATPKRFTQADELPHFYQPSEGDST